MIVGGTGFYLKWLMHGRPNEAHHDVKVTREIEAEVVKDSSWDVSLKRLEEVDPVHAKKLSRNDYYRLVRSLVVHRLTGRPVSSFGFGKSSGLCFSFSFSFSFFFFFSFGLFCSLIFHSLSINSASKP